MPALRAILASHRPVAALLLALALWMRLVVPDGYMIGADTGGRLPVIEICTGHGAAHIADPTGKKQSDHAPAADHICAFAAASAAVDLIAPLQSIVSPTSSPASASAKIPAALPGRGLAAPPPPKTGPPALA